MNMLDLPVEATESWPAEAEASVVGGLMMMGAEAYDLVGDVVRADRFFSAYCRVVFQTVEEMVLASKTVDLITVWEAIQRSGNTEITLQDLHGFQEHFVGLSSLRRHAAIVAERAVERDLLAAAADVRVIAADASVSVADRIHRAQTRLEEVTRGVSQREPQAIENFVAGMLDRLQDYADGKVAPGIPTQIPTLDQMLGGGLKGGKQIIIAARPSVGKSSLAQQLCLNVARQGHTAAMLSMEMSGSEMTDRAVANLGRVSLGSLETGRMDDDSWGRLAEAVENMRGLPLFFDDQPALTLTDITTKARALKRKHGLKLLVIDYLQLCASGKSDASRHHQIEEISRGLKALARQLDITILTLSQLNREAEKRQNGRPVLSDLKESGAIEEDADIVLMMWRHRVGESSNVIGLAVPKNRQGRVGEVALHFEGEFQRWGESTESLSAKPVAKPSRYSEDF